MDIQSVTVGALKSPTAEDLTRLSTLSLVSKCLNTGLRTETLLQGILETILPAFQADRGFIQVFGPPDGEDQQCFLDLTQEPEWQAFTFTSTLLKDCLRAREAILVFDGQEELSTHSVSMSGIRSVMLTPLIIEQRLLGSRVAVGGTVPIFLGKSQKFWCEAAGLKTWSPVSKTLLF